MIAASGAVLAELDGAEDDATKLADAFGRHLSSIEVGKLPSEAQIPWREIARLLKCPADKPAPEKAVAAIRSWPKVRVAELIGHIQALHAVLEQAENNRLEDEIRDKIRHHYL